MRRCDGIFPQWCTALTVDRVHGWLGLQPYFQRVKGVAHGHDGKATCTPSHSGTSIFRQAAYDVVLTLLYTTFSCITCGAGDDIFDEFPARRVWHAVRGLCKLA